MKPELTKKNFCKIIDGLRDYCDFLDDVENVIGAQLVETKFFEMVDVLINVLLDTFYHEDQLNTYPFIDDITYFMWELDFGRKWKSGMVTKDGVDIPLRTAEDLWELLTEND